MLTRALMAFAVTILGSGATTAHAATIVDVSNLAFGTPSSGTGALSIPSVLTASYYQTFQVRNSGTFSSLDLFASGNGDGNVYVDLYRGGSLTSAGTSLLASVSRQNTAIIDSAVNSFSFATAGIAVTAGEYLTFRISVDACPAGATYQNCYRTFTSWTNMSNGATSGNYAEGSGFSKIAGGSFSAPSIDLNFRTFVDVAPVPEPATWAMMLLGFGGIGVAMRRRSKVSTRVRSA